jgi:hypothetical protein
MIPFLVQTATWAARSYDLPAPDNHFFATIEQADLKNFEATAPLVAAGWRRLRRMPGLHPHISINRRPTYGPTDRLLCEEQADNISQPREPCQRAASNWRGGSGDGGMGGQALPSGEFRNVGQYAHDEDDIERDDPGNEKHVTRLQRDPGF